MTFSRELFRRMGLAAAVAIASLAFTGCTTNSQGDSGSAASQRAEINGGAEATLSKLYQSSPEARALVSQAKGVLVFPSITSASLIVGASYGKGVLREGVLRLAQYEPQELRTSRDRRGANSKNARKQSETK